MENNHQIDLTLPIAQIISAKVAYHKQEIYKHQKQVDELLSFGADNDEEEGDDNTAVSQRTIKPIVQELLQNNPDTKYTTNKLLEVLQPSVVNEKSHRRKLWIQAISSSLSHLVKYEAVQMFDEPGKRNEYQWKSEPVINPDFTLKQERPFEL